MHLKSILAGIAFLFTLGTSAEGTPRITNVVPYDAVPTLYNMEGTFYSAYGWLYYSSLSEYIYTYGNNVWFSNLFPKAMGGEFPVKGEKSDGCIVCPSQKIYENFNYQGEVIDLYFKAMEDHDDGYAHVVDKPVTFYEMEDGSYSMTQTPGDVAYCCLVDGNDNIFTVGVNYILTPYVPDSPEVVLPEGAVPEEWVYSYKNDQLIYTNAYSTNAEYYQEGDDVYLYHLTPEAPGWVKGKVEGDKLYVPTHQFLGYHNTRLAYLEAGGNYSYIFEWVDEASATFNEYIDWDPIDQLSFTKVGDAWKLDDKQCICEIRADGGMIDLNYDFDVRPFKGYDSAVPADPENPVLEDLSMYYGVGFFSYYFNVPPTDSEGNKMVQENLEFSIFVNNEPYIFSTKLYQINEDMQWIPYGFKDNTGGMDIRFTTLKPVVYLYTDKPTTIGAQIRYTQDGVTMYSNIVNITPSGEISTVACNPDGTINGITNVPSFKSDDALIYDLNGKLVKRTEKGQIYIKDGKKIVR